MKKYQGTKVVQAEPMTMQEAFEKNLLQAGKQPREGQDGYMVVYSDGYKSWSPKEFFEDAYIPCETFDERIKIEWNEVMSRHEKLHIFIESEKFKTLDKADRNLLITQLSVMQAYGDLLLARLDLINSRKDSEQ